MKRLLILAILLLSFALAATAYAVTGYPWKSHAEPYDFQFENNIDAHQQSKLNGRDQLGGFFYIKYTGTFVDDVPEAEHGDCDQPDVGCTVGWTLKGIKSKATLFANDGGQHPQWCIETGEIPPSPGYSHFHWLNESANAGGLTVGQEYEGYLLKLTAVDHFYFQHHGSYEVTPGIDTLTHDNVVNCP
jgi:hypothetical protein